VATTRTGKRLSQIVALSAARRQFGQIFERAHKGKEKFVVHSRGNPLAVIIGIDEYYKYFAKPPVPESKRGAKGSRH
jgi:prevent-host-death family protein